MMIKLFSAVKSGLKTALEVPAEGNFNSYRLKIALVTLAMSLESARPALGQEFELVVDLAPGSVQSDLIQDFSVDEGVLINGYTLFQGCTEAFGCELWRSNGTALGTEMVADLDPGGRSGFDRGEFAVLDGIAYFAAGFPTQLWRTDGTPEGTEVLVERIAFFGRVWEAGGALWFDGWDKDHGAEPWTSDGTRMGAYRVADLEPGPADSNPAFFTAAGDLVYFSAETMATGRELYASDGTEAGTYQVADIQAGSGSSAPVQLNALGPLLLFRASDGSTGSELWRTDGTGLGTVRLEIMPGAEGSAPTLFGELPGGVFLLSADDGISGRELWRTNGTVVQQVIDLNPGAGTGLGVAADWIRFGDHMIFTGISTGTNGEELFRSDGTAAGTTLVADISVGGASTPRNFVPVGDTLYFSAWDIDDGRELWATNLAGTVTTQVANLDDGEENSLSFSVTGFPGPDGLLLFAAEVEPFGFELWRTDGTPGGTLRLTDIVDPASSLPSNLTPWQNGLAFQPLEGEDVGSLVTTDGSEFGTLVFGFPFDQIPTGSLLVWQDELYLSETSSLEGTRLWSWSGFAQTLIAEDSVAAALDLQSTLSGVAFSRSGALSMTDGTVVGDFASLELASPPEGQGLRHWYGADAAWYTVDEALWRTDLVNDTSELLVDLDGDPELSILEVLGESGGVFYFTLERSVDGELEQTLVGAVDDSPQGYSTVLLFDGVEGALSISSELFDMEGQAILLSEIGGVDWRLHTLGQPSSPAVWIAEGAGQPSDSATGGRWLAFRTGEGLWRSDGTSSGTALIDRKTDFRLREVLNHWALVSGPQPGRGVEFALIDL
ncbi:MAG: hypothetical protein AAF725_16595, partial [Acidobacteriota bacterium]